jgi:hypothetical protein
MDTEPDDKDRVRTNAREKWPDPPRLSGKPGKIPDQTGKNPSFRAFGINRYVSVSIGMSRYRSVSVAINRSRSVSVSMTRYYSVSIGMSSDHSVWVLQLDLVQERNTSQSDITEHCFLPAKTSIWPLVLLPFVSF